jgi:hypothetical protein
MRTPKQDCWSSEPDRGEVTVEVTPEQLAISRGCNLMRYYSLGRHPGPQAGQAPANLLVVVVEVPALAKRVGLPRAVDTD